MKQRKEGDGENEDFTSEQFDGSWMCHYRTATTVKVNSSLLPHLAVV
jgi:hypothetical protein